MKRIFLSLTLLALAVTTSFGQQKINFKWNDKRIQGVVFPKEYSLKFEIRSALEKFTPSIDNIKLSERYLLSNDGTVRYSGLYGVYAPKLLNEKFKTYKRQYIGFIDTKKDTVILVQLLDFKQKKIANQQFAEWENEFMVGLGEFFENNSIRILINLSRKTVSLF